MDIKIIEILKAMELQGLSQTALAKQAGLPQKSVNDLLSGRTKKPDMVKVDRLRKALGLSDKPLEIDAKERDFKTFLTVLAKSFPPDEAEEIAKRWIVAELAKLRT